MDDLGPVRSALGLIPADLPLIVETLLALGLACAGALLVHHAIYAVALRGVLRRDDPLGRVMRRARGLLRLVLVLIAIGLVLEELAVPPRLASALQHAIHIAVIVLIGWATLVAVDLLAARSARAYRLDAEDNLTARKVLTQLRILKRAVNIVTVLLTIGAVLMTFEGVREYGVSLFASAGAAGLVLGFAARPVLANLIAGIQIALTQPIRIDDVVVVEGEWGRIEEILATYVVVRIWDLRRLVVPLSYFIEQPFQNWTRETAAILGSVHWYADYTMPVDAMRAEVERVIAASPR